MNSVEPVRTRHAHAEWTLRSLPRPGHIMVLTATGWLVARENGPTGWTGLVQYELGGAEINEYVAADQIASPDIWITGESTSDQAGLADGIHS